MAILMPNTVADSTHWATTKKSFNKFTTGTSMGDVHICVIDNLIVNAVEKPSVDANLSNKEFGMIIVDNNGAATWAKAGTDYISPSDPTTLTGNEAIYLGSSGDASAEPSVPPTAFISGNGDGRFVKLEATNFYAENVNITRGNGTITARDIEVLNSVGAKYGYFDNAVRTCMFEAKSIYGTKTNGSIDIYTVQNNGSYTGTIGLNGDVNITNTLTVPNITVTDTVNASIGNFTSLKVGNYSVSTGDIAAISISDTMPIANTPYQLWVDTSTGVLKYRTNRATATWTPLGAVFK